MRSRDVGIEYWGMGWCLFGVGVVNLVCQRPIIQAMSRGFIMLFDMSFGVEFDVFGNSQLYTSGCLLTPTRYRLLLNNRCLISYILYLNVKLLWDILLWDVLFWPVGLSVYIRCVMHNATLYILLGNGCNYSQWLRACMIYLRDEHYLYIYIYREMCIYTFPFLDAGLNGTTIVWQSLGIIFRYVKLNVYGVEQWMAGKESVCQGCCKYYMLDAGYGESCRVW
jgi:hypothetical protein